MTATLLTTEDTLLLDQMLAHEARCESPHSAPANSTCSGSATHRYQIACGVSPSLLICTNSAAFLAPLLAECELLGKTCAGCLRPCNTCWTVTPA
jgi:hypothetical protein